MNNFMNGPKNVLQFRMWVIIMLICTLVYGFVYVALHQYIRQSANDAQMEIVEEITPLLSTGNIPHFNVAADLMTSLKTFVVIYNENGKPISSSAVLGGVVPTPPLGVFEYVRTHGSDRVTWQPQKDVRIAAVIGGFKVTTPAPTSALRGTSTTSIASSSAPTGGFVLVGKSLRQTEVHTALLTADVVAAWICSAIISGIIVVFLV